MQLSVWTYEGPPHVGAMRVATAMKGLHYVLHAPQGDTYADLLFTMIERRNHRPPVTYTTFEARDLGKDTAQLFQDAAMEAVERFNPEAIIVGASCTAELIQDDPGGLSEAMDLPCPAIPLELPSYQRKENWGAAETFYQIVRNLADTSVERAPIELGEQHAVAHFPTKLLKQHGLAGPRRTQHEQGPPRPLAQMTQLIEQSPTLAARIKARRRTQKGIDAQRASHATTVLPPAGGC